MAHLLARSVVDPSDQSRMDQSVARWATSPLFRFWWPLLGPMFSPGFRKFIDEHFRCAHERRPTGPPSQSLRRKGEQTRRALKGLATNGGRIARLS